MSDYLPPFLTILSNSARSCALKRTMYFCWLIVPSSSFCGYKGNISYHLWFWQLWTTSQGLWLAAALSLPAMFVLWNCDSILPAFGQEESNVLLTKSYLHALVWGLPARTGFLYLKQIAAAINFPQFGMVIIVVSMLLNVPVNYVLMFGYLGFLFLPLV